MDGREEEGEEIEEEAEEELKVKDEQNKGKHS